MFLPQFAARAILDLEGQEKNARKMGYDKYALSIHNVILLIRQSAQVILPENGEIYRDNGVNALQPTPSECESFIGLPAPITCFQYPWNLKGGKDEEGLLIGPKRITLAVDSKQTWATTPDPTLGEFVILFSIVYAETHGIWFLLDTSLMLPSPLRIDHPLKKGAPWGMVCGMSNIMLGKAYKPEEVCENPQLDKIAGEWKSDLNAVIQACHSLRAGATLVERKEQSATRRRKFANKGVGGFTYHILTLPSHTTGAERLSSTSHASPRFHVRRAHIRNLPTGALTFVRQCFVGDPYLGKVEKSYQIKR